MGDGAQGLEAFSPEWFAAARDAFKPVQLDDETACRVQFVADGTRWFLALDRGRLTAFDLGTIEQPDVELRWSLEHARQILTEERWGTEALQVTTVAASTPDGPYVGPPAPANLLARPEIASMPAAPGATLDAQYVFRDGPFGEVNYAQRYVDGRLVEERLGELAEHDVLVRFTYGAMARVRAHEWTVIDALDGGAVSGEMGPLAALDGIVESPEYRDAELATGPHMLALAALGELDADSTYRTALEELVAATRWS